MSDDDADRTADEVYRSADDDWFERALSDADEPSEDLFTDEWAVDVNGEDESTPDDTASESESTPDDTVDEDGPATDNTSSAGVASQETVQSIEQDADELEAAFDDLSMGADITDEWEAFDEDGDDRNASDDDQWGTTDEGGDIEGEAADDSTGTTGDERNSLFEQDFGAALNDAPDLPGESGDDTFDFGGEFDMESDDFDAFSGSDSVSGAGGFSADSEEDTANSTIGRIELGIEGLDAMIQGGVPERSLMVAIGSAGTGKTTLGLQFLNHGLESGERCVYITLEESRERVIRSATEKGFAFDEYTEEDRLAVVDIDPVEMANSLQSIRNELPRLIDEFGASRLVLDSVSLLEMMYDSRAKRRNEIYDFTKSLKRAGVTTLMTSEASTDTTYASRHGIVEYLTDAVFLLQYVRPSDFRETQLAIEIQKIRDANHSRETKPYEITNEGINVYRQANIF